MLIEKNDYFLYVGSVEDDLYPLSPEQYSAPHTHQTIGLLHHAGAQSFYFQKQTHGICGKIISPDMPTPESFSVEGDYSITQKRGCALGVLTADCLPIALYDPIAGCVAAIHAGWRGSVSGIVKKTIEHMTSHYGSNPYNLRCYIGPSARVCCYEVGRDVADAFARWGTLAAGTIVEKNGILFCDLVDFTQQVMVSCGVLETSIEVHPSCTIDDTRFFSYRRQGSRAGRQMMIICLR